MGEYLEKEGGVSMFQEIIRVLTALTFALVVVYVFVYLLMFIKRVMPVLRLRVKLHKAERQKMELSRIWNRVEKEFVENRQFRETFYDDPEKLGYFLDNVDQVNGTNFCSGDSPMELAKKFIANPKLMKKKIEEYLNYKMSTKQA